MMMMPRKSTFGYLDDLFRDTVNGVAPKHTSMKTDIKETERDYSIIVDLPGYNKEDIKVDVNDGYITIEATINNEVNEEEENYVRRERYSGTASRSFYVGDDITTEDVKANFRNGVLTLVVPKKEIIEREENKSYVQIDD